MKLHAVTVCVDFDDYLEHSLPLNRRHFDEFTVITERASPRLRRLISANCAKLIETRTFRDGGAAFNKGKGLNVALRTIPSGVWVMILDADIVLPPAARGIMSRQARDRKVIYGAPRSMCPSYAAWMRFRLSGLKGIGWERPPAFQLERTRGTQLEYEDARQRDGVYVPLGYLQLFWVDPAEPPQRYLYSETSEDASQSDLEFAVRWTHARSIEMMPAIHLPGGPPQFNWRGRRSGCLASGEVPMFAPPVAFASELKCRPRAHGGFLSHFHNGNPAESGRFSNGLASGIWSEWHLGGNLENAGSYSKGLPEGKWRTWYENGQLAIDRTYSKGRPHGPFLAWHRETGKLAIEAHYDHGRLNGRISEWHPDGTPSLDGSYRLGLKHGMFRAWHPDGSQAFQAKYADGKEHGSYTVWHESHHVAVNGRYWYGRKHGCFVLAYRNGQKMAQMVYQNGRQQDPAAYWPQLNTRAAALVPHDTYHFLNILTSERLTSNRAGLVTSSSDSPPGYVIELRNGFVGFDGIAFDSQRLLLLDPAFLMSARELCRTSRGICMEMRRGRMKTPALIDLRWPKNWSTSNLLRHPRYRSARGEESERIVEDHAGLATIVHRYSGAYYHWVTEAVPRLLQVRNQLNRDKNLGLLVDYDDESVTQNTWTDQYLRLLGVDADRVVRYHRSKIYAAERILLPGPIESGKATAERLLAVRDALLGAQKPSHPGCVIAASRTQATCRRVTNWCELLDALRRACHEREVVDFDAARFTVAEQIALFAGAAAIVGPHGAGLANMIYCPPAARVIELLPRDYIRPGLCFQQAARALGLWHRYVIADESGKDDDFQVDVNRVSALIARVLSYRVTCA